jgi:hypothetical protein
MGVMLNTHHHLAPRLRMSGTVPLLPLHAFMGWTGINFYFITYSRSASCAGVWGIGGMCLPILNLRIDGVEWSVSPPGTFTPGEKSRRYPLSMKLREPQSCSGYSAGDRNILPLQGI